MSIGRVATIAIGLVLDERPDPSAATGRKEERHKGIADAARPPESVLRLRNVVTFAPHEHPYL
jgi:hypothetical protein